MINEPETIKQQGIIFPKKCCICLKDLIDMPIKIKLAGPSTISSHGTEWWSEIDVPICSSCSDEMETNRKKVGRIGYLSAFAIFIGFFLVLLMNPVNFLSILSVLLIAGGGFFFYFVFPGRFPSPVFGRDGLQFPNKEYQSLVIALNKDRKHRGIIDKKSYLPSKSSPKGFLIGLSILLFCFGIALPFVGNKIVQKNNIRIALDNNKDISDRRAAIHDISDQETLLYIARTARDARVRASAVFNIENREILFDLAKNANYENVRWLSADKLSNQEIFEDIIKTVADTSIRRKAIAKLDAKKCQELLAEIAGNDESDEIRLEAIERLDAKKWQELLAKIAIDDKSDENRFEVIGRLDSKKWQKLLARVAEIDKYSEVRIRAVKKLDPGEWQILLKKIALNDKYYIVRIMAITKLKDQKVLAGIAENGMYSDERSAAKQRLENLKTGK